MRGIQIAWQQTLEAKDDWKNSPMELLILNLYTRIMIFSKVDRPGTPNKHVMDIYDVWWFPIFQPFLM